MAWEAGRIHSAHRMHLAQWVLRQRLQPQDPLALHGEPEWLPALLAHDSQADATPVATINHF
jgi:hypothetical protein